MIFQHSRFQVWGGHQHPYRHSAADIGYSGGAFTSAAFGDSVTTLQGAMDWIVKVLYPKVKDAVDETADLPTVGNDLNDYRVVKDDGDGKMAAYRWEQREGDVSAKWYKVADYDWSSNAILSAFEDKTQNQFVYKRGVDDADSDGVALTGDTAGQHIYGGVTANSHLTLHANSGDGTGAQTGYVQFEDSARPLTDSSITLGTNTYRWLNVYADEGQFGTLNVTDGSITDSSGAISFGDEDLTTTGDVTGASFVAGTLTVSDGSIVDSDGTIDFGATALTTTGDLTAGLLDVDNIQISGNTILSTDTDGNLNLQADGTGIIDVLSNMETLDILAAGDVDITGSLAVDNLLFDGNTLSSSDVNGDINITPNGTGNVVIGKDTDVTGVLTVTGSAAVDNLTIDGNTLSSTNTDGNIILDPNGTGLVSVASSIVPSADGTLDLGATASRLNDLFLSGGVSDGTNEIAIATLLSLRDVLTGINAGDTIFWDDGDSKFVASAPDTEIDHGTITGLDGDDHTQYMLLAGRSGGQTLTGGTDAGDDLLLQSTSDATKGQILVGDDLYPDADATHDLGSSSAQWVDLYLTGQAYGMRLENVADATARGSLTGTEGRIIWQVDTEELFIGQGASWKQISTDSYYNEDAVNWDGATATVAYDVSSYTDNAKRMVWQFKNNGNDFEIMAPEITHPTDTTVKVTFGFPITAGTYTLVGR